MNTPVTVTRAVLIETMIAYITTSFIEEFVAHFANNQWIMPFEVFWEKYSSRVKADIVMYVEAFVKHIKLRGYPVLFKDANGVSQLIVSKIGRDDYDVIGPLQHLFKKKEEVPDVGFGS